MITCLKKSNFFSIMADESTDISTKKELSVCGRWLEDGTVVEHFLGIIHNKEATAEALTQYLLDFLRNNNISLQGLRGLGFDGTNTMSGERREKWGTEACEIVCSKCSVCSLSLSSAPVSSHSCCERSQ